METGTRSLRRVFRNGSCNDCPLAIIYLLVITLNSWLSAAGSLLPCCAPDSGRRRSGASLQCRSLAQRGTGRSRLSSYTEPHIATAVALSRAPYGHRRWIQERRAIVCPTPRATRSVAAGPGVASRKWRVVMQSPKCRDRSNVPTAGDSPRSGSLGDL